MIIHTARGGSCGPRPALLLLALLLLAAAAKATRLAPGAKDAAIEEIQPLSIVVGAREDATTYVAAANVNVASSPCSTDKFTCCVS